MFFYLFISASSSSYYFHNFLYFAFINFPLTTAPNFSFCCFYAEKSWSFHHLQHIIPSNYCLFLCVLNSIILVLVLLNLISHSFPYYVTMCSNQSILFFCQSIISSSCQTAQFFLPSVTLTFSFLIFVSSSSMYINVKYCWWRPTSLSLSIVVCHPLCFHIHVCIPWWCSYTLLWWYV